MSSPTNDSSGNGESPTSSTAPSGGNSFADPEFLKRLSKAFGGKQNPPPPQTQEENPPSLLAEILSMLPDEMIVPEPAKAESEPAPQAGNDLFGPEFMKRVLPNYGPYPFQPGQQRQKAVPSPSQAAQLSSLLLDALRQSPPPNQSEPGQPSEPESNPKTSGS